jgi:hypothetical protein
MTRPFLPLFVAVIAAAGVTTAAIAETPTADQSFLDAHLPSLTGYSDKAPGVTSPADGLAMTRKLLAYRSQALNELQAAHPLTSPDGIETQDAFDAAVVSALDRLARAAVATDTTHATPKDAENFMAALGPLPEMGNAPLAFMVVELAELTSMTADTLSASGVMSRRMGAKIAMQIVATAGDRFFASREDEEQASNSQSLRQSAIVMRLRCPKDGGVYRINSKKNKVRNNGSVVTLYYLQCQVCADPLLLEFPYVLATKLNKMAEKQKLPTPPQPLHPTTVDP